MAKHKTVNLILCICSASLISTSWSTLRWGIKAKPQKNVDSNNVWPSTVLRECCSATRCRTRKNTVHIHVFVLRRGWGVFPFPAERMGSPSPTSGHHLEKWLICHPPGRTWDPIGQNEDEEMSLMPCKPCCSDTRVTKTDPPVSWGLWSRKSGHQSDWAGWNRWHSQDPLGPWWAPLSSDSTAGCTLVSGPRMVKCTSFHLALCVCVFMFHRCAWKKEWKRKS